MTNKSTVWWGTYHLEENQNRYWEIGPLLLGIERLAQEWRIGCKTGNDPDKSDIKVAMEENPNAAKCDLEFKRYVFHKIGTEITFTPIMADRPQVSLAATPFYLPAGEQVTIYVSSPAWIRIEAGSQHKIVLDEIPTVRQSDTWYGPNTREGELCYFSPMFCRTHLKDLPIRSHRIISPIVVHNHAPAALLLDRLSLPLPYLSVYADSNGSLWSEEIIVTHDLNRKHSVKQGKGAPDIAPKATLISAPRLQSKSINFLNLFHSLLAE